MHSIPGNCGQVHQDNSFSPHRSRACNYKEAGIQMMLSLYRTGEREKTLRGAQPGFPGIIAGRQPGSSCYAIIHACAHYL